MEEGMMRELVVTVRLVDLWEGVEIVKGMKRAKQGMS